MRTDSISRRPRKQQNIVVGKKVSGGLLSWKGADLTMAFYVGFADINSSVDDMRAGIEGQGVGVVELEEMSRKHNRFKSFRLVIRKKDVDSIKNPDFWPEEMVVRKFFQRSNDGNAISSAAL